MLCERWETFICFAVFFCRDATRSKAIRRLHWNHAGSTCILTPSAHGAELGWFRPVREQNQKENHGLVVCQPLCKKGDLSYLFIIVVVCYYYHLTKSQLCPLIMLLQSIFSLCAVIFNLGKIKKNVDKDMLIKLLISCSSLKIWQQATVEISLLQDIVGWNV